MTPENDLTIDIGAELSVDDLDDNALLGLTRQGHDAAYGALYERYVYPARRLARHLGQREETDDVVSDAFAQILDLLRRGKGPDRAFRAYLFTAIRNDSARRAQASGRVIPTDDETRIDRPVPFGDGKLDDFEKFAIRAAYESLPARWRTVLWHLDVEGRRASDLAGVLDLRPNSVSALVYRARSGLRDAYLRQHIGVARVPQTRACTGVRDHLASVLRQKASVREQERVQAHLEVCMACRDVYVALEEVNRDLGAILTPMAVAGALAGGAAFVGAGSGGAVLAHLMAVVKGLAVAAVPAAAATVTTVVMVDVIASHPDDTRAAAVTRTAAPSPQDAAPLATDRADSDQPITLQKTHASSAPDVLPIVVPQSSPAPTATVDSTPPSEIPLPDTPSAPVPSQSAPGPSTPSQPTPSQSTPSQSTLSGTGPVDLDLKPDAVEVTVGPVKVLTEPVADAVDQVVEATSDLLSGLLPRSAP